MKMNVLPHEWYAVYTRSRSEKRVFSELSKKSIETYLPLQRQLKQWSDRKKWIEEPLISSYVFVRISEHDYFNVLNTSGVVKFISFSGKPARIRDSQIEVIRKILTAQVELDLAQEDLSEGDLVEITEGTLRGVKGELIDYKGKKRVIVKIDEIGHSLVLTVPLEYVRRCRIAMAG